MKWCVVLVFAVVFSAGRLGAEQQTWTGELSDSACGAKHEEAAEGAGKMSERECTLACVHGGSQYVLVSEGKVYKITNQSFGPLTENAGKTVKVTGELKDGAITVNNIGG